MKNKYGGFYAILDALANEGTFSFAINEGSNITGLRNLVEGVGRDVSEVDVDRLVQIMGFGSGHVADYLNRFGGTRDNVILTLQRMLKKNDMFMAAYRVYVEDRSKGSLMWASKALETVGEGSVARKIAEKQRDKGYGLLRKDADVLNLIKSK